MPRARSPPRAKGPWSPLRHSDLEVVKMDVGAGRVESASQEAHIAVCTLGIGGGGNLRSIDQQGQRVPHIIEPNRVGAIALANGVRGLERVARKRSLLSPSALTIPANPSLEITAK